MAPEPDWELWRYMDRAHLWQLVALLAGLDPDSISHGPMSWIIRTPKDFNRVEWNGVNENFHRLLRIAESSLAARSLACITLDYPTCRSYVRLPEFLRWAHAKGLRVPPELQPPGRVPTPPAGAGDTARSKELVAPAEVQPPGRPGVVPAGAGVSTRIEGIKGLRDFIAKLGLTLGDEAAVRTFAKKAGIMQAGDNPAHEKRSWDRAEVEPKLREAIKERLKAQTD